mgnify:CR=1 FL=1
MALLGTKLNKKVIMVVEKLEELRQIITISKQLGVEPLVGLRARLLAKGAGRWAESAGDRSKFGLTLTEVLDAVEYLKKRGMDVEELYFPDEGHGFAKEDNRLLYYQELAKFFDKHLQKGS